MTTDPHHSTSWAELQRRIVYTLIRPAMRICRLFRLPLGAVEELCRMAYFEEVRIRGGASQAQTALLMGKSLRTVGNLERQHRSGFLAPETELLHTREVESAFDDAPLTLEEIHARVPHLDPSRVSRILDSLVGVGRVKQKRGAERATYLLNPAFISLVRDDVDAQLDGLGHQLDVITAAVQARFLASDRPAIARTLNFVGDSGDMEALGDGFILELRRKCIEAEESALKRHVRDRYAVTFVLTPMPEPPKGGRGS